MRLSREMTLFLVALVVAGGWGWLALSGGVDIDVARELRIGRKTDPYALEDWTTTAVGEGLPTLAIEKGQRSPFLRAPEVIFPPPLTLEMPRLIDLDVTMPPPSPRPGYDRLEGLRRALVARESTPDDLDETVEDEEDAPPLEEPPQPGARKDIPPEEWEYIYDALTYTSGEKQWGEIQDRSHRKWHKWSIPDGEEFWWILKDPRTGRTIGGGNQSPDNVVRYEFARTVENFFRLRRSKVPEREPGRYDRLLRLGEDLEAETWRTEDDVQEALKYAAESYREALETKKDDVAAILALSRALRGRGEWEENLTLLEDATKRVANVSVHVALGEIYEAFDLPDLARETYEKCLSEHGTDARLRRRLGDLRFAEGDLATAADLYRDVVRFGAEEDEKLAAQIGLGRVALRGGRLDDALDAVARAEQMSGEPSLGALSLKAAALYLEGKNAEAAEAARAALDIHENHPPAVRTLGLALAMDGGAAEARSLFAKAREADPFLYADSCFGLGFVAHLGGQAADAMEWYEHASAASPDDPYFHYLLGVSYRQDGRIEDAKGRLLTALRLAPGFLDVLRQLGLTHQALENWTESVRFLRRAVDLAPEDGMLRYVLGCSLLRDESMPRKARLLAAREQAEAILELESDQPLALNLLGYVLYALEPDDSAAARAKFIRVVNLVGRNADDPDGGYGRDRGAEIREHESRVIWRDTFDGREVGERWITYPAWIHSRVQDGLLRLDVRHQKDREALFYQWLKQASFGQLVEVTAEFLIPEKSDVNIGLAITKKRRAGTKAIVIGEIAVGRTFRGELAMRVRGPKSKDETARWTPILADADDPESVRDWPTGDGGPARVRVTIRRTGDHRRGYFDVYVNDELVASRIEVRTLGNRKDVIAVGIVAMGQSREEPWSAKLESLEMVLERR